MNKLEHLGYYHLSGLKIKGEKNIGKFISECYLSLPGNFSFLLKNCQKSLSKIAKELSRYICQERHMLPITNEEIMMAFSERKSCFVNLPLLC